MYHGEKVGFSGKILQVFKDEKGEEHFFQNIQRVYFGDVYQMENEQMQRRPAQVESDWSPTEKERAEYEAQKIVLKAHRQDRQKEMKIKKPHKDFSENIDDNRPGGGIELNQSEAGIIVRKIEEIIERQESDQGDWIRAKEMRAAKPALIAKLRKILIQGI